MASFHPKAVQIHDDNIPPILITHVRSLSLPVDISNNLTLVNNRINLRKLHRLGGVTVVLT